MYENSDDIAMSSKGDNVYSNSGQKVQNKDERGYKVLKKGKNSNAGHEHF